MSEMTIIPDLYLKGDSTRWKNWQAIYLDIKTCEDCRKKHGKIYGFSAKRYQPEHLYCRCAVIPMRTKEVGVKQISTLLMGTGTTKEFYTLTTA